MKVCVVIHQIYDTSHLISLETCGFEKEKCQKRYFSSQNMNKFTFTGLFIFSLIVLSFSGAG